MTEGRVQELLREAAELLRAAGAKVELSTIHLDVTHTVCESCKIRHYKRFDHYRTYKKITDVPTRLNNLAESLIAEADKLTENEKERLVK